jgi:YVTN family beta-propeller protein
VPVGNSPYGVVVTPDRTKIYVANADSNNVSVIDVASNTVTTSVNVGTNPYVIGQFIGKIIPTITWSNPANITYGTALSGIQLDATASVPGNFVYNPPSGTVLNTGQNQQLNTTFTPSGNDAINYTTASKTVYINVIPAMPSLTLSKIANLTSYFAVGQVIGYNYTVKNTGNVDIKGPITVKDDKFGTITMPNSDILDKDSSVTGTATYKITDADINAGSVTNAAYAKGSFNNNPISSPLTVALVRYKHPTKKEEHNEEEYIDDRNNYGGPGYGGYGGAVIPMIPGPMYSSPIYGSEPYGPTETLNSDFNGHKAKAHLSKHKHKNHSKQHKTKHHKTEKKNT